MGPWMALWPQSRRTWKLPREAPQLTGNICRDLITDIHLSDISKEEHRGKTSPEQVQPELRTARRDLPPSTTRQRRKKRRKTDANRDDIQRRLFLRRRRPKGPIMQVRTRTTKQKDSRRSKPVFAQPFFLISNFTSAEYLSYQTGHLKSSTETTG